MRTAPAALAALSFAALLAACDDRDPLGPQQPPASPRLAVSTAGAAPYSYRCARSLVPDQAAANERLRADYEKWRSRRVWSDGAGGDLRVTTGPNFDHDGVVYPYATITEGQGYGMLLAVHMGDKHTFDELWAYAKRYRNSNGMVAWLVDRNGSVVDWGTATDGDQDMAYALLVADKQWGGYSADLTSLAGAIRRHAVEAGTYVLKPGDDWGGSHRTYPGYYDPAWYKAFATYLGDPSWNSVADQAYAVMANVDARGENGSTGFVPDYMKANADTVHAARYVFSWNAIRAPWRLAKDAVWNCDARAKGRLDRMNSFFQGVGPANILSGYRMRGDTIGNESYPNEVEFVGPLTAASLTSTNSTFKTAMWNRTVELGTKLTWNGQQQDTIYYAAELRLLAMLLASGNMEDPLAGQRRLRVDDFESASITRWWTFMDGAGSTLTKRVIRPAAVGYGMEVSYGVVSWAGIGVDVNGDWSGYRSFEFWVRGGGTGNRIGVEIEDADGELFRHEYVDDFTGWRFVSVPLDTSGFPRRTDWQPTTVNNGLTLAPVKTLRFTPLGGQGTLAVDRIELIPR